MGRNFRLKLGKKGLQQQVGGWQSGWVQPSGKIRSVGLPNAQDAQKTCKTGLLTRKLLTGLSGAENNFKNPLTFSEIPSRIRKDKRRTVEAKKRLLKKS